MDAPRKHRRLRVGYVSGPSDADRIYEDLKSDSPRSYFGTNYMRQFLLLMEELEAEAVIETWHGDRRYRRKIDNFTFNNIPQIQTRGLGFHLQHIAHMLGILIRFLSYRPDVVVLTGNQEYWWVLAPMRLTGTRFVASFHSVIWPPFLSLKRHYRLLLRLNQHLILRHLSAAVSTSRKISEQFRQLAGQYSAHIPLFEHLPTWQPQEFDGIAPADQLGREPFATMFMGRIERDKGVYDLVQIARELHEARPGEFEFHLCGDGTSFSDLSRAVDNQQLGNVVHLHGYCPPERMKAVMGKCHAVIVPTRIDCPAGFEMTCAEAILGGRPLITSAVAPALDYLQPASIEVPPEDADAYREAIVRLKDDRNLYRTKQEATAALRDQFFAYENSWDRAMRLAFADLLPLTVPQGMVSSR